MQKQSLETLFEKYKYDNSIAQKSKTWFQQQMLLLSRQNVDPKRLFREGKQVTRITPGKLYMFYYDPKGKDTLPYYDKFPLVFPYKKTEQGMMGLNMHYLPHYYRVQLMTRLTQFATNKTLDENTRIKYSWSLIAGVSKFKLAEACIKHYLMDHVVSNFIEVPGQDWHTAMMLPVERFVGSNKLTVWGDSVKK
jgi:hypothetical protein